MARPNKDLDYFPLDLSFFNDLKVRKLLRRQGSKAVTVYISLLCLIYKNGYYIGLDEDLLFVISEMTGCEEVFIQETLKDCLRVGLFDQTLYEEERVLTSKGIQMRYADINERLRRCYEIDEYCLVSGQNDGVIAQKQGVIVQKPIVNVQKPMVNVQKPMVNVQKRPQIKEKKNKEKPPKGGKKKVELSFPPSLPDVEAFVKAEGLGMVASEFVNYNEAKGWEGVRDWKAAARRWADKESTFGQKSKPRSKDPTVATWSLPEDTAPKRDAEADWVERYTGFIEAYHDGRASPSIVALLKTAKRNGALAKHGLEWSEE